MKVVKNVRYNTLYVGHRRQTDRQTERQTDGWTQPRDHTCHIQSPLSTIHISHHLSSTNSSVTISDVERGQDLEAEAEVNFWRLRSRPRPKIIMKKVPNND